MSGTSKNKVISKEELRRQLPKSKFTSDAELRALGGIAKGQLISKEHLRGKAELIKELPKSKFKSEEHFLSYAGSMKGQYIGKAHLRDRVWRKRA